MSLGLALRETMLGAGPASSAQLSSWIALNGEPLLAGDVLSTEFTELDLLFRWRYDTRNREGFPERGLEQSVEARAALPASDIEYFTARYDATRYWTAGSRWTVSAHGVSATATPWARRRGCPRT